uniref:Ig-like domain-containing protein n=1 Tax=Oryctolagus cuniculus TaxID=9986 RepID=U3KP98_RABIT
MVPQSGQADQNSALPNPEHKKRWAFYCCAMACWLLPWSLFCLLGAGPVEAGVTQTPRYLIQTRGQQVSLTCTPDSGHNRVVWYQQVLGQGLQFLFDYYLGSQNAKGNVSGRFSAHQFSDFSSEMNVSTLELQDSAVYLCASSLAQPRGVPSALCTNLLSQGGAASADTAVRQATAGARKLGGAVALGDTRTPGRVSEAEPERGAEEKTWLLLASGGGVSMIGGSSTHAQCPGKGEKPQEGVSLYLQGQWRVKISGQQRWRTSVGPGAKELEGRKDAVGLWGLRSTSPTFRSETGRGRNTRSSRARVPPGSSGPPWPAGTATPEHCTTGQCPTQVTGASEPEDTHPGPLPLI